MINRVSNQRIAFMVLFMNMCPFIGFSQDIHFSQFGFSPVNTNPANTGLFDGDYRVGGIYRNQWSAVPVSYNSVSFFGDTKLKPAMMGSDRIGVGMMFNHDVSGDNKYSITQLYLPISFIGKANRDSTLLISVGISPGISSIGFKTPKMTFDTQYDGNVYNASLPSQENFAELNQNKFDLNIGAMVQYYFIQRGFFQAGVSAYHIVAQRISYFNTISTSNQLDVKGSVYFLLNYPLRRKLDGSVEMLYSRQGKANEFNGGVNLTYFLTRNRKKSVFGGLYFRPVDAIVARAGFNYKTWKYTMGYDLNISGFKPATSRKGAFEFGLIYIFKKQVRFIAKKQTCPVYL